MEAAKMILMSDSKGWRAMTAWRWPKYALFLPSFLILIINNGFFSRSVLLNQHETTSPSSTKMAVDEAASGKMLENFDPQTKPKRNNRTTVFLNGGILIGYISNYGFSKLALRLGWRLMLGVGAVPSIFLAVAVLAMPESPRWLVAKGRLGEAKKVLYKISDSEKEAWLRLADIKDTVGIPQDCVRRRRFGNQANSRPRRVERAFPSSHTRGSSHLHRVPRDSLLRASHRHRRRRFVQPQNLQEGRDQIR
ncbi:Polyol transporter 5 [Spatholobus suberectus]|nr:Polyol transporter 5 [Spatholobus suberectus]